MKNANIKQPLVSVIIPTYNSGLKILEAVRSVKDQIDDLEIIVIDDGSIIPARIFLKDELKKIRLIEQVNMGVAAARNKGLYAARGKFVAWLDADDVWVNNSLDIRLDCLEKNPNAIGVLTAPFSINKEGDVRPVWRVIKVSEGETRILEKWEYCLLQQKYGYFSLLGFLSKRKPLLKTGGFDQNLFSSEDQDFLFKLIHNEEIVFLQKATYIRMSATMTADTKNFSKLKHSQYKMIRNHIDHVKEKWNKKDAKYFWDFHDMAIRQCIKLALAKGNRTEATIYQDQLHNRWSIKNFALRLLAKNGLRWILNQEK